MIDADVEKHYTTFTLSAKLKDSGIISIIGKNGSGKTTFLKIIAGIIKPDRGYVKINDKDVTNLPINKRNVIFVNQESYIPNLKVKAHLTWGAKIRKIKLDEKEVIEIAKTLEIPVHENKKVEQLSLGNKEKVALGTALLARPKVILVDEGFSNISNRKEFIKNYFNLVKEFKIEIVYVTQDLEDAKIAEKTYYMNNGFLETFDHKTTI